MIATRAVSSFGCHVIRRLDATWRVALLAPPFPHLS